MVDFVICVLANLFRIYLIDRFVSTFLGKAEIGKIRKFLVCASFYVINTALFLIFHTAWINIICNLIGISAIVRLYTKSFKTNMFVTGAVYLINLGCDVAVNLSFISYEDGQTYSQIYVAISVFLIFICELLTEKVIKIRDKDEMEQNLPLIFVPICSIVVIIILIYSDTCADIGIAIVGIGLLVVNFLMLYLYNLLQFSILQKYETEMLRQKVAIYANQLNVISQSEEKVKSLRHDMKHHLNELKLLANKCNVIEIQKYIEHMEVFIQNPNEIVASGNMEIDSVLNYMLQKAREELETVNCKIMLPEKIKHSFDINVLLGNLLENAIEAAKQTDKKYLSVNITLKKGVLRINIKNSFLFENLIEEGEKKKNGILLTTKKEKEQHGIGLKNVRKIVEAYDGVMEVTQQNDIFCVKLILYMFEVGNEV